MKVVLFCGGLGTRLKEFSETIPKPMVDIGYRPIMWHLMKYYAAFGHTDFILCLGYRGDIIRNYFLNYDECLSNDFVLSDGGRTINLLGSDISEWTITFVDTGLNSNIGQRLMAVRRFLRDEKVFMANYADGLTDLNLAEYIRQFHERGKVAGMLCVQPPQSFHVVSVREDGLVNSIAAAQGVDLWINGGYFIFRQEIFNYINDGEELVYEPFQRLIAEDELLGYRHRGFWACMDTIKEKMMFDDLYARGYTPWTTAARHVPAPNRQAVGLNTHVMHFNASELAVYG